MRPAFPTHLTHERSILVTKDLTVPALPADMGQFPGMPEVLATPYLICLVEAACLEALAPHLPPEWITVGTRVDFRHLAPSAVGRRVTARVTLTRAEGRRLEFHAACLDGSTLIGEGLHERVLVKPPSGIFV